MDYNNAKVLFSVKKVSKDYGEGTGIVHALKSVSLDIYDGELLCILGESGSGKSTLLNLVAGLDRPNEGSILFYNKESNENNNENLNKIKNKESTKSDVKDLTKCSAKELTKFRREEIGFIFQFFNLIDEINVYQNLTLTPGSTRDKDAVKKILGEMGIEDKMYKYPRELSGGEQQRVSIGRAINKKSSVILCDEPTGALDYKSGKEILKLLEKIHNEEGKTLIIVTHTIEIAKMCDRIITVKSGKIIDDTINTNKIKASEVSW